MSISKDKNTKLWEVYVRYLDWQKNRKSKHKRGFKTKREALEWQTDFLASKSSDVNMNFKSFVEIYLRDRKPRLKYNTYLNKVYVIEDKIVPYFKNKALCDISSSDIIQWQNKMLSFRDIEDKPYSQTYLRTIQNQLSAILNHACKFYGLNDNPSRKAGKIGKSKAHEMNFWTKTEYLEFIEVMKDRPKSYYAFEILFWCGMRVGELLSLTTSDIDLKQRKIHITKSYQRLQGKDYITCQKTEKSVRDVLMPDFLVDEIEEYITRLYKIKDNERLFPYDKSFLHKEMTFGANKSGVKRIRIHDLRHSHVALLIELGFSPVAIASRLGHESIEITYNYAHLYPSKQTELVIKLNDVKETTK